eukprot:CAMPEP_0175521454 /NCGR_PEP_ID=MMETSP0096-20121207/17034_1 /TAXON_ID=311494 /ORGANISM="Alexandrium monilatum, Strain CCMP3105" /LENGTH=375 /DNA_ID=CAMNT_0016823905 /DNA_START=1 /DNA_END=1128 /DNA_ORIENTATION=+
MRLSAYFPLFQLGRPGSRQGAQRRPSAGAPAFLSAPDVEMAGRPWRRVVAEGVHGAADESASLVTEQTVSLLQDKIYAEEGVEYSHSPIPGTMYRACAFWTRNSLEDACPMCESLLQNFVIYLGVVQILAPVMMFIHAMRRIDWNKSKLGWVFSDLAEHEVDCEKLFVMTLGYMFLIPFLSNLVVFCKKNMEDYIKLRTLSLYLREQNDIWISMPILTWGCIVHCLITPMIMMVTWYLTATSSSPIDITMNMLGVGFVVGMDQLAADFADTLGYFMWDDQNTGDFLYDTLKDQSITDGGQTFQISSPDDVGQYPKPWWYCASNALNISVMVLVALSYSFFEVKLKESPSETETQIAALNATVAALQAQVAALSKP